MSTIEINLHNQSVLSPGVRTGDQSPGQTAPPQGDFIKTGFSWCGLIAVRFIAAWAVNKVLQNFRQVNRHARMFLSGIHGHRLPLKACGSDG